MRPEASKLLGVGSCLPETLRTNDYWPPAFIERDEARRKRDIVDLEHDAAGKRVEVPAELAAGMRAHANDPFRGARVRRVIGEHEEVSALEAAAAANALADAKVGIDEVDALLVHSLIPDLLHPSNAPAVQDRLGLTRAVAIAIDNGCASPHVGMVLADGLIQSGRFRRVLVVCSSAPSRAVDLMNPASPVFGDAAAAYVVGPAEAGAGLLGHSLQTDGYFRDAMVHATMVEGRPERDWYRHCGHIRLATLAPDRARESGRRQLEFCRDACMGALASAGVTIDDIALFLGPQSVAWLNDALCRSLGLPPERTLDTFVEVANIGSATMPFNLERARRSERVRPGELVLAYTPGAGLTRAAVVFRCP